MQRVESIDDPRVAPYRNLRERTLRGESIFVTEGRILTRRLLESDYQTESVFVAEELAAEFVSLVGDRAPLYVAASSLLAEIVGFPFHRGVLGCGRRPPPKTLAELMTPIDSSQSLALVVCPEVNDSENLGLIFRTAAGLGVDGVLLGQRCCDPLSRRSLRLSMGGVLGVPFTRPQNLLEDLQTLKSRHGVELLATVLDDRAERIGEVRWPPRAGLLLGNEAEGLPDDYLSLCDRRVMIPMRPGTDSLNVGVAAGIFIYELMRSRGRRW